MKSEIFNINQEIDLGYRFDHNTKIIFLTGFERLQEKSTLYLKMSKPVEALVPLTDDLSFTVQQYMTLYSGRIRCQILELSLKTGSDNAYEIISNSPIFYAMVKESISNQPEITDPSLDLIYTQMHEMYLTIKNAYASGEFKGDTPIKGTDYWTDTDKQEIVDNTTEAMAPELNEIWEYAQRLDGYNWATVCALLATTGLEDYNEQRDYSAGKICMYWNESDYSASYVAKALKDVPANTEETYLDDTEEPDGITNGYWEYYSLQDILKGMNDDLNRLNTLTWINDTIDNYEISKQYHPNDIVKCEGVYYTCLKNTSYHDYSTELPSPGVKNGYWKPLITLANLYPSSYMINDWIAGSYKVGEIVKYNGKIYRCIKQINSYNHTTTPDVDIEYWELYEVATTYGDEILSLILDRYTKSETYSQGEVNDLISKIPKFAIEVVTALPTADISETTVYLLKTSEAETGNLYTEYIYVDSKWEMLGTQKLDLSSYYKSTEVDQLIAKEKTERQNADAALDTKISDEITRAKAAEADLETKVSDEATTARAAETTLQSNIDTLETKISDEAARAKAAESAETTRATNAEQANATAITTETTARENADTALQTSISEEKTARENADAALDTKISDEITRAKAAEADLETKVSDEATTARAAETTLQSNIDTLETKISDEAARAKAAESAETTRATNAEQANATAITTETTARENADTALQTSISEEKTARENADNDILSYLDRCFGIAKPITAKEIKIACRNGNIKSILGIGESIQFEVDGVKRNFLVMDFIENGQHSSGLKLMDNLQTGVIFQSELVLDSWQFDAKEAFYANAEELAAGTYNFTLTQYSYYTADAGKTFQFTTTQTIPANSKFAFNADYNVTLTNTAITIYKEDGVTAIETLTLTEGSGGTSLGELNHSKNGNLNASQRARLGNNNWKESAIRQRLNSDSATTGFWIAQNIWDMPPSWNNSAKGFLNSLSDDLRDNIARVERHTYRNTVSDEGGYDTTYDKIWLPSKKEIFMPSEFTSDDTEPFAFYQQGSQYTSASNGADPIRVKVDINGTVIYWWLESPHVGSAHSVRIVSREGACDYSRASYTNGVAPDFVIA